jgi:hypothetical protein
MEKKKTYQEAAFEGIVRRCLEDKKIDSEGRLIDSISTFSSRPNTIELTFDPKKGKSSIVLEGFKGVNASKLALRLQDKLKADVSVTCVASSKFVDTLQVVIVAEKTWKRGFLGTALQAAGYFFLFSMTGCAAKWFGVA